MLSKYWYLRAERQGLDMPDGMKKKRRRTDFDVYTKERLLVIRRTESAAKARTLSWRKNAQSSQGEAARSHVQLGRKRNMIPPSRTLILLFVWRISSIPLLQTVIKPVLS
jgi:hypothetical protein